MGFGFGFDIRQISNNPWDTISLSIDTAMQNSILQRSYFTQTYFPNVDYLLDPRYSFEMTKRRIEACPMLYQTPMMYTGVGTGIGDFYVPQMPQIPLPGMQQSKPETAEEKEKREAREAEDKKQEAKDAKAIKENFDKIKTALAALGVPLSEELIKKADEAMKKEKAEDRLKAMQAVVKSISDEKLLKSIYSNDEVKSKLVDAGFNLSKYIDEKKLYLQDKNANGAFIDWRSKDAINNLYQKLKKDVNKKPTVEFETFTSFATSAKPENILGIVSNWNDVFHSNENKSILRHVANNLPSTSKEKEYIADRNAATSYAAAITTFTNALLTKADTWTPSDKYPKLYAARKAVQDKLDIVNKNAPDNLTKENVMSLADAFDKLYARLRMMEAERVNQFIQSKFKSYNKFRPNFINDELVIKETAADLKNENITTPANIDKVEKSEDLLVEEDNEIEQIGLVDKDNIATLVSEGQLTKVAGQEGVYSSNAIYCNGDGDIVSKTANGKKLFITKYYKLVDDKLVPAKKTAEGKYVPYSTTQVTSSEIKTYNDEIARVQKLADDEKIIRVKAVDAIIPKVPLFKATASNNYFVWRKGELVRIKNVKSVTSSNGAIHVKVEGAKSSVTLEKLMEDGDNFETFSDEELKTVKQVEEEKAQKARDEANQKRANAYKEAHPHAKARNDFNKERREYRELTTDKLKSLGLEALVVDGWYKSTDPEEPNTYYRFKDNKLIRLKNVVSISEYGIATLKNGRTAACNMYGDPADLAKELYEALYSYTNDNEEKTAARILRTFNSYTKSEDIIAFLESYYNEAVMFNNLCTTVYDENGYFDKEVKVSNNKTVRYGEYFVMKIAEKMLEFIGNNNDIRISTDDKYTLKECSKGINPPWYKSKLDICRDLDSIIKSIIEKYREKHPKEAQAE